MRPTQALRSDQGGAPVGQYNKWIGNWGSFGTQNQRQKGIVTYGLAPNRQNPLAGAGHAAIFNTWRRASRQAWFWLPPVLLGYGLWDWAEKRNHYLNSKAGQLEYGSEE